MKRLLYYWFFFLSAGILSGQSSSPRKVIKAHKIATGDIILDGRPSEPFWEDIEGVTDFQMQEPVEGGQPTERTLVKIAYDQNNLYLAIVCYDSEADGIKSFQMRRDASLDTDDRFRWILDTYLDGRNAYFFETNPRGLMSDGLLTIGQGTTLNENWDGIWRPWTHIGPEGWSAEIRLPFRTLNFDPAGTIWGINFQRTIRRKNEELLWSGHQRNQGLFRPQNAGRLVGLENISQGLGLEVVPYTKVEHKRIAKEEPGAFDNQVNLDGGLDINYNLTAGLRASVTVNTDFAETEIDNRQVNLTRFPLFFPERRDFFLEGANIYQFAPRSGIYPYFSRKIGLDVGKPVPINYGVRVIGRMGRYELAAQQVRTKKLGDLPAEDFSVLRLKRNFLKESSFGLVYTRRHTKDGELLQEPLQDRHTLGADLALNTSSFLGNKNLQFQAFAVVHNPHTPEDDSTSIWDRSTRGIRFNFPNKPWSAAVSYREFGDLYDPPVGFNRRRSFRRLEPQFRYSPLIEKSRIIRELTWGAKFEHLMSLDWEKLTQNIGITPLGIRFETGDAFEMEITRSFERLVRDFDILGDGSIVIPVRDYTNWIYEFQLSTASYRKWVYDLELTTGGFWSGNRTTLEHQLTARISSGINLSAVYVHTRVDLEEGHFQTKLVRFIGNFDLTPFLSISSNIQYDDLSQKLGMNNRFRYTITPGSDIFIVYNHNWMDIENRFRTTSNTEVMKARYTHRF